MCEKVFCVSILKKSKYFYMNEKGKRYIHVSGHRHTLRNKSPYWVIFHVVILISLAISFLIKLNNLVHTDNESFTGGTPENTLVRGNRLVGQIRRMYFLIHVVNIGDQNLVLYTAI